MPQQRPPTAHNPRSLPLLVQHTQVSHVLAKEVIPHVLYHKGVPLEQRAAALQAMASAAANAAASGGGPANAVMVSTDAAARGIDLPDITHVVQADFATAAVDFLHRIGRTARADRGGKVTSLVSADHETLARVLQVCVYMCVVLVMRVVGGWLLRRLWLGALIRGGYGRPRC